MRNRVYPEGLVSYVPFHFPNNGGKIIAGLEDEVSSETWSFEGVEDVDYCNWTTFPQIYTPYSFPHYYVEGANNNWYVVGTNNSGILNFISSGDYEIEIRLYFDTVSNETTGNYEFNLENKFKIVLEHEDLGDTIASDLVLSFGFGEKEKNGGYNTEDGETVYTTQIELSCPSWGINREYTQVVKVTYEDYMSEYDAETGLNEYDRKFASLWLSEKYSSYYRLNTYDIRLLLRISECTAKIYLKETEVGSVAIPSGIELRPDHIKLGGFVGRISNYALWHKSEAGTPKIPEEIYTATLNVNELGGFGTGADGNIMIKKEIKDFNCCGLITGVKDARTFEINEWIGGNSGVTAYEGCEIMIHITKPRAYVAGEYPYLGMYAFRRITRLKGTKIILNRSIKEEIDGFTLSGELAEDYFIQAIVVPNFTTAIGFSTYCSVTPVRWQDNECGGILVFRTTGDCTMNGNHLNSAVYGGIRAYDSHQLTHHTLLNRFLCSKGGGVMIFCGGKLTIKSGSSVGSGSSGSNYGGAGLPGRIGQNGSDANGNYKAAFRFDYIIGTEKPSTHKASTKLYGGACALIVARTASIYDTAIRTGGLSDSTGHSGGGGFCYMAIGELVDG